MKLIEALDIVLSQMEFGQCRALTKDDFKYRVYELMGHYPRSTEFDKAFESFRVPVNKYGLVYSPGIGWYRTGEWGLGQYKQRLNEQIKKKERIKRAL